MSENELITVNYAKVQDGKTIVHVFLKNDNATKDEVGKFLFKQLNYPFVFSGGEKEILPALAEQLSYENNRIVSHMNQENVYGVYVKSFQEMKHALNQLQRILNEEKQFEM